MKYNGIRESYYTWTFDSDQKTLNYPKALISDL